MDFEAYQNEIQKLKKLKRRELIELLEKKYNQICTLNELVREVNIDHAWSIWINEFVPKNSKSDTGIKANQIKFALENKINVHLVTTPGLPHYIVSSDLIIAAYKKAIVDLESPTLNRKLGIKKSVSITLTQEQWDAIDNKANKRGSYFRDLAIKDLDSES